MCCGNNSKFKQLSLGKSGNCLEISVSVSLIFYLVFTDTLTEIFFFIFLLLLLSSKHS